MKLIAHRGLFDGPDANLENRPEQIHTALSRGYDCEIDLWVVDSKFFLGHDRPDYEIKEIFLYQQGLWIHAKNLDALQWLTTTDLEYFWHQTDDFVITSHNWIWTYPGKKLTHKSVSVLPEWHDAELKNLNTSCYGICSDYVTVIENLLKGN